MKILIFGFSGMIGSQLLYSLNKLKLNLVCAGRPSNIMKIPPDVIIEKFDVLEDFNKIESLIVRHNPDYIINALAIIKQRVTNYKILDVYKINALFPQKLATIIKNSDIKMIHLSTDCVFDGLKGYYSENDFPKPTDDYGLSKFLGEVTNTKNVLTLRTSFIGHEIQNKLSLLEWFLNQSGDVCGYSKAFYSGLTTVEVARVIAELILGNFKYGLFHLAGQEITKLELLRQIKNTYKLESIKIIPTDTVSVNRTLNCQKFQAAFKYEPKPWFQLIEEMQANFLELRTDI